MQRPVMNPNLFEDDPPAGPSPRGRLVRLLGVALRRTLRLCIKLLAYDPLKHIPGFRAEEGTPTSRFVRGLMYRLSFVPLAIAATACAIVWAATHPRPVAVDVESVWLGIHYDPVTFGGPDQIQLEGWLVPVLDAKTVLDERDAALRKKHPAVVLVHDMGQRSHQMLPLIRPLHDRGYVVLTVNLRGGGGKAAVGETFGLREADDVRAAAALLRCRPFIDPKRIAILGCGTGATAALLAASADPQIAAVVAERPVSDEQDLLANHLLPQQAWMSWISPLCKWTFEIAYGVDAEDVALSNFKKLRETRPVLMMETRGTHADPSDERMIKRALGFLDKAIGEKSALASE